MTWSKGLSEPGTLFASSLGASMVATKKRGGDKGVKAPTPKEVEENLKRANLPKEQSAKYHPYYQGKIEIVPRVPVRSFNDFAIWYTPGVAQPCLDIAADPSKVWTLTNKWNQVAIVTDGTRVLGLGDIGPRPDCPSWKASPCCSSISEASTRSRFRSRRRTPRKSSRRSSSSRPRSAASTSRTSRSRSVSRFCNGSGRSVRSPCGMTTNKAPRRSTSPV